MTSNGREVLESSGIILRTDDEKAAFNVGQQAERDRRARVIGHEKWENAFSRAIAARQASKPGPINEAIIASCLARNQSPYSPVPHSI